MTTWLEARIGKANRQDRERRLYGSHNLGPTCPDCREKVPAALNDAGITHHPTCGPDARALLERHPCRA